MCYFPIIFNILKMENLIFIGALLSLVLVSLTTGCIFIISRECDFSYSWWTENRILMAVLISVLAICSRNMYIVFSGLLFLKFLLFKVRQIYNVDSDKFKYRN